MNKLVFLAIPLLAAATPALSADFDEDTVYRESTVVVETPAPVVQSRVVERRYYYAAPSYEEGVVVVAPRYRAPHVYQDGYVGRGDRGTGWGGPRYRTRSVYYGYGPVYYGYRTW